MAVSITRTILAGDAAGIPPDSPSLREDNDGLFPFVGALSIIQGSGSYVGSAVALSRNWVLTAGHNADFNDDGVADNGLTMNFHLPGFGVFGVSRVVTHPDFTGFGTPTLNDDLALLNLSTPLPLGVTYPSLSPTIEIGMEVVLAGFGRSGYGNLGYTTSSSPTTLRYGSTPISPPPVRPPALSTAFTPKANS